MPFDRREFLHLAAGGVAARVLPGASPARGVAVERPIKAVAFDAFPIFDLRPIFALAETLFPGRGAELGNAWKSRQFEYQWLRALGGRYADFAEATGDALVFAARQLQLELTPEKRAQLTRAYLDLKAWPDVAPALETLRGRGFRLAFLSNMTPALLDAGIRNAGLVGIFEHVLSTDAIRTYKPDPRAYQMAVDALRLRREEILFAAFAGWDVAGAKWFGYPTFWVNRAGAPAEQLGVVPDGVGKGLGDLVSFVEADLALGEDSSRGGSSDSGEAESPA
jgi:2-haloacid dehalogenase